MNDTMIAGLAAFGAGFLLSLVIVLGLAGALGLIDLVRVLINRGA